MIFRGFVFLFAFTWTVHCEVFTAITDLEDILQSDRMLIEILDDFIKQEENRFQLLKEKANIYRSRHAEANENVAEFLANPINAFLLIKRLTVEWAEIEELMFGKNNSDETQSKIKLLKREAKFPAEQDLQGAAVALTRLQDVYKLETADVSRGILNGIKYIADLSPEDCYEVGIQVQKFGDHIYAASWLREALYRLEDWNQTTSNLKIKIYRQLPAVLHKIGFINTALSITTELLKMQPNDANARSNQVVLAHQLRSGINSLDTTESSLKSLQLAKTDHLHDLLGDELRKKYESLCRGEVNKSPKRLAKLKCRYIYHHSPYLRIAPLKMEEVHHNPDIVIYYNVISDLEIATVQKLAKPRIKRAIVFSPNNATVEVPNYRISKSGRLDDAEHKLIRGISLRVEDMTGMTVSSAEQLQVTNYGVGGHYEPHYDFVRKNERSNLAAFEQGNRVATVMFYMTDVVQGGATVFPVLSVGAWPKKGSAVFWYNLHATGERDYRSLHAGCPVLLGNKWVCNKWQHIYGQEFRRPCQLEPDSPILDMD